MHKLAENSNNRNTNHRDSTVLSHTECNRSGADMAHPTYLLLLRAHASKFSVDIMGQTVSNVEDFSKSVFPEYRLQNTTPIPIVLDNLKIRLRNVNEFRLAPHERLLRRCLETIIPKVSLERT